MKVLTKFLAHVVILASVAIPSYAVPSKVDPLVTKTKVEDVAKKCGAKVAASYSPSYDDHTGEIIENGTLVVSVQRSNSPEAIACVNAYIPTVITIVVGRDKSVPALDQQRLDAVLKDCDWRKEDGVVELEGDEVLRFQPNLTADYDRVDCVLSGLRQYSPKFGFVGNEQYLVEPKEQK